MKKLKAILTILLCGGMIFGFALICVIGAPKGYSVSERRALAQLPAMTAKNLKSGKFMSDFETYSMDQFPLRDQFRSIKATASTKAFGQKDNHGLYIIEGNISKLEYPANAARWKRNEKVLNDIKKAYLDGTDCKAYLSVIPDKNRFLAPLQGYPTMDYEAVKSEIKETADWVEYIDIDDLLSLDDFYKTDQHWKQENIVDVAERITEAMEASNDSPDSSAENKYEEHALEYPFYGAYVGQSALSFEPDTITYLTNNILEQCAVTSYNSGMAQEASMYDMSKAYGRDPYEMFLGGSDPLIVIENPNTKSDRELVVFRDSFGSSLVPLLCEHYKKITVVDLRYMRANLLGNYVTFADQDVLFLYSTLILNNSISM